MFQDNIHSLDNTISFKIYLKERNNQQEIRRFGIDSKNLTFINLEEKIKIFFPKIKNSKFIIYWIDNEGDEITVSTTDELEMCLYELKESVKKIYLKTSSVDVPQFHAPNYLSNRIHRGILCDSCQKEPIQGFRYKCIECPDYDLCPGCEAKGEHKTHFMIRIPNPELRPIGRQLARILSKIITKTSFQMKHDKSSKELQDKQKIRTKWLELFQNLMEEYDLENGLSSSPIELLSDEKKKSSSEQQLEYLNRIGKMISTFLDHLGFDVDVKVRQDEKSNDAEETPKNISTQTSVHSETKVESSSNLNPTPQKENPMPSKTATSYDLLDLSPPQNEVHLTLNKRGEEAKEVEIALPPPKEATSPQSNIKYVSSNPNVQRTLEMMLAMGFTNDGNWLLPLIEYKQGDIDAVLDILQPHQKS